MELPLDELPLAQRLAASYAPRVSRDAWRALLLFDARLAGFLTQMQEPILAQMRLAWWRDQLKKPVAERPSGDPVLGALGTTLEGRESQLVALVDGWERLIADPPWSDGAIAEFVAGRSAGILGLADATGSSVAEPAARDCARIWALSDLAHRARDDEERTRIFEQAWVPVSTRELPRTLRPLAVLAKLAGRSLEQAGVPMIGDRRAVLLAMRVGLFGR